MTDPHAQLRRALGPVGAFVGIHGAVPPAVVQRDAVRRVERAGYSALWTNEVVGTDALVRAAVWLAATERLVVGTCIANMWARPAPTAHAAATTLEDAFPGRFVLGLGVGNPAQAASVGREFGRPQTTARDYLGAMPDPAYPRVLAANGPAMTALAVELCDGALPAGQDASYTATARRALGAAKLLVVYLPVQDSDTATTVADAVSAHRRAGADHVIVGRSFGTDFETAVAALEQLAPDVLT